MPWKLASPCSVPGCPSKAAKGGRCAAHAASHLRQQDQRRGSRHERGYGSEWQKVRADVLKRDKGTCWYCGGKANSVDHIVPKSLASPDDRSIDDPSNLVAACVSCNSRKGNRL